MTTINIANALIIVLAISGFIYLGQASIIEINPDNFNTTLTDSNNLLYNYGDGTTLNEFNASGDLPSSADTVSAETGSIFTDLFKTVKTWIVNSTGLNYVIGILKAPYDILSAMMLPSALVWVIGSMWYGLIIFLIVSWALGRT